jgi:RNA polymerase sigma factor (sigma-70 family)
MASEAPESVGRSLRQLFAGGGAAGLVDGQLLERLAAGQGAAADAAFEAILDRHGSMVLATCRRVLGDHHAAEDAFQATFLVLVRRAGSLRVRDSLGPWLHEVATRTALKARTGAARRQARERRAAVPEASGTGDAGVDDLGAALHAEVARLPAKYRAPVVLCYFEGRTHDEAAVTLAWPVGTVRGRLSRARALLRSRLARRGLAPAGVLGVMLSRPDSRAEVSAPLRDATIAVATGVGSVGAGVAALTRHTLRSLLMAKVKMTGAMAVAVALLATGAVLVAQGVPAVRRPAGPEPAPPPAVRPDPAQAPRSIGPAIRCRRTPAHGWGPSASITATWSTESSTPPTGNPSSRSGGTTPSASGTPPRGGSSGTSATPRPTSGRSRCRPTAGCS